jgi:hypothetical protein
VAGIELNVTVDAFAAKVVVAIGKYALVSCETGI